MKISIVTPSYNQGRFIAQTIESVLDQGYPDLEYIVVDGASTDESQAIIARYADRLAHWSSEPDAGQYDAINKGFARSTGDVMAWLNSDDRYLPWTLQRVAEIFAALPQVEWISTLNPILTDSAGIPISGGLYRGFNGRAFFKGEYVTTTDWYSVGYIMQEGTFWRRSLWERAGGRINTDFRLAGDFELWARFFQHADLYGVMLPLAMFRTHPAQRSRDLDVYLADAVRALRHHGGAPRRPLASLLRRYGRYLPRPLAMRLGLRYAYPIIQFDREADQWITRLA